MSKTDKRTITAAQRRAEAVDLRMAGYTYKRIAEHLNVSEAAAYKMIKKSLAEASERTKAATDEILELELARLDKLTQTLWPLCIRGDLKAMDRMHRVMERRAKLLGLDAAVKLANTTKDGEDKEESGVIVVPAVANSVEEWLAEFNPQALPK